MGAMAVVNTCAVSLHEKTKKTRKWEQSLDLDGSSKKTETLDGLGIATGRGLAMYRRNAAVGISTRATQV